MRGRKANKTGEVTKTTDLRRTIHVLVHAIFVLRFLCLVLSLPMSWGRYSEIPVQFLSRFPYVVDFATNTWADRIIIATTALGLVCLLISDIVHLVALCI